MVALLIAGIILIIPKIVFMTEDVGSGFLSEVISFPRERIPIEHALESLEIHVKEARRVETFCQENFREKREIQNDQTLKKTTVESPVNDVFNQAKDCADLYHNGVTASGVYTISLRPTWMSTTRMKVFCDMSTDGGGWTVIQRRGSNNPLNFTRDWLAYSMGFGDLTKEFWLGNENIHKLTSQDNVTLRFDLQSFRGALRYAKYEPFEIKGHKDFYQLILGTYKGDAGDSFSNHNQSTFNTYDVDTANGCSKKLQSGWWFNSCVHVNLNGEYLPQNHTKSEHGLHWYKWTGNMGSLKWTEMKLRPVNFK